MGGGTCWVPLNDLRVLKSVVAAPWSKNSLVVGAFERSDIADSRDASCCRLGLLAWERQRTSQRINSASNVLSLGRGMRCG
jgi:hypothetical protein